MYKWDIFYFDQIQSRLNTDPIQPNDPRRPQRPYVIISPNVHINAVKNDKFARIVCLQIGSQDRGLISVELKNGVGGVLKDCYVWCNEIYTLPMIHFKTKVGSLLHEIAIKDKIEIAMKDYLELH